MFTPLRVRDVFLKNRIVVSPMAQYSAVDGVPGDYHLVHLGARAMGGAALVMAEMTCVSSDARITPACPGMYAPEHTAAWRRIVDFVHGHTDARIGIQLGHAGPKGSTRPMWDGIDQPLPENNWPLIAASAQQYLPGISQVARAATEEDLARVEADFVLDASGYGRVLPRLLDLEAPSNFPMRQAVFTHVEDCIDSPAFEREKILITTHPTQRDIWFWTIPFSNGRCSVGVVAAAEHFAGRTENLDDCLRGFIAETPSLAGVLNNAVWDTPARTIGGYSANVKTLHGPGFALLGNAAEFLDPVFSSGVTIAMRSASMAAGVLHRQLQGESVDWQTEFAEPLKRGVDTFRCYVEGWYAGTFQDVIFYQGGTEDIRRMISSILAGYAWDERNPFVSEAKRRLRMISELCAKDAT